MRGAHQVEGLPADLLVRTNCGSNVENTSNWWGFAIADFGVEIGI
jgi:hypothetical protein